MKYSSMMNLSLQQMQIFLKCYRYCNYSRVAEEYNYTPSMISKTVKALEELLGLQLFIRRYHALEPTSAAHELAKGWEKSCDQILETICRACDAQERKNAKIKIGVLATTGFCADYVMIKLEDYKPGNLLEDIHWERQDMHELPQALEEGKFDMVITWSGEMPYFNVKEVAYEKIFSSPDALFVPRGNPLFGKPLDSLADCRPYPFITLSPTIYPHYCEYLEKRCKKSGFSPAISAICGSTDSARYNLALGKGVYLAPALLCCDWVNEDVEMKIWDTEGREQLVIVWKKKNMDAKMKCIVDAVTH